MKKNSQVRMGAALLLAVMLGGCGQTAPLADRPTIVYQAQTDAAAADPNAPIQAADPAAAEAAAQTQPAADPAQAQTAAAAETQPAETQPAPPASISGDIDPTKPMVAVTFDDGPSSYTSDILDVFEDVGGHATFFMVGENVTDSTAPCLSREIEMGCELGNHTYDHEDLTTLGKQKFYAEIERTNQIIGQACGRVPTVIRPPYGAFNERVQTHVSVPLIYWSVDTRDWDTRDASMTVQNIKENTEDGDIILMHDIYEETAAAVREAIPYLVQQGYQLVTVSELMYYRGFEPANGTVVFSMHPNNPNYTDPPNAASVYHGVQSAEAASPAPAQDGVQQRAQDGRIIY